jgi:hypothetical protein
MVSTIYGSNFCCNSKNNEKTQPLHWLATDPTTKIGHRGTKTEKKWGNITNKGACRELLTDKKLPTYKTRSKVDPKNPTNRNSKQGSFF